MERMSRVDRNVSRVAWVLLVAIIVYLVALDVAFW